MTDAADRPRPGELEELARSLPPLVRFGTSTWTYPGWHGLVYQRNYSARASAAAMLAEYAQFPLFSTVGIDSSFYRPPEAPVLESYARALPPGFPCVSKVWQDLTVHSWTRVQDRGRPGERNPSFLDPQLFLEAVYEPHQTYFAEHTGPLVFEFQTIPSERNGGLSPAAFADHLDEFFGALPAGGPWAVEVRNPDFLTPKYFAVLREHGVAHVFNAWTRMPSIGEQLDLPEVITGPFLLARALLTPGRTYEEAVDTFAPYDRIREPHPQLRLDLERLIRTAVALRLPAYVIVNNRAEGSAPLTIVAVARRLLLGEE